MIILLSVRQCRLKKSTALVACILGHSDPKACQLLIRDVVVVVVLIILIIGIGCRSITVLYLSWRKLWQLQILFLNCRICRWLISLLYEFLSGYGAITR